MNVNKAILVGRVGADPIINETGKGDAVANISLATNFGKLANTVGEYVKKGQELYVEGRITYSKYTDREGVEKHSTSIIAYSMQMGAKKNSSAVSTTSEGDDSLPF